MIILRNLPLVTSLLNTSLVEEAKEGGRVYEADVVFACYLLADFVLTFKLFIIGPPKGIEVRDFIDFN